MAKNKYVILPDEVEYEADIEAQIVRLREVLKLMSPETGSAALGAMRKVAPNVPLAERVKVMGVRRA